MARRRQSRDVRADRQLQSRPGPRQGPAGKALALNSWSIAFSPAWPLPLLAGLAALAIVVVGLTLWRRPRAAVWRALAGALLLLGLLDPSLQREDRRPLKNVVAVVIDRSGSNRIGQRERQTHETGAAPEKA